VSLWLANVAQLTRRSITRMVRQPGSLFFALFFPLLFLAVIANGLSPADRLPGFPGDTYLDFAIAIPFVHGALFASSSSGTELARDIETGFLNRLALTPAGISPQRSCSASPRRASTSSSPSRWASTSTRALPASSC
jgi:ABC-2 type transport system permease protein